MSTHFTDVDTGAPAPKRGARLQRERSFTLEQFGDLVSSALDIQRIPDSALAFSIDKNNDSELSSTRRGKSREPRHFKSGTFTKFKGAFTRKHGARDASFNAVPPEIRRLASSSTPVLSQPHFQNERISTSLTSLELVAYGADYDTPSIPATPTDSVTFPSISIEPLKVSQQRTHTTESSKPDAIHDTRKVHQSRSFLNLRPLTIPKLTKKSSKLFFSSGSPPTPPPEQQSSSTRKDYSAASVELSRVESDGMRSFFDDSGYAESEHQEPKMAKKKSRTSFRSLFSINSTDYNIPPTPSLIVSDNSLPPTPLTGNHPRTRQKSLVSPKDTPNAQSPELYGQDTLFYTPSVEQHRFPVRHISSVERLTIKIQSEKDFGVHRVSNWINRPTSMSPQKPKRIVKNSPPAYPCPTSPLPPTPELPAVGLPAVSPPNSDHLHATDNVGDASVESIDSSEIMSWRMPALEQQVSKTSTTSSMQAHLLGRPSRASIRERLGLGPRLQLHVPLPTSSHTEVRSKSPADPRIHLSRLTSASLVSLRSVATITAGSKAGCDGEENSTRRDGLDVDRAFTPEDDPFAAGPVTPTTSLTSIGSIPKQKQKHGSTKSKYHSFMPLGNDSTISTRGPNSAPASLPSWCYRLGSSSNMSSPALTPSSSTGATTDSHPKSTEASTSPSSVRSGLPPSLIDALGVRRRAPSTPSLPPSSCRNLGQVLSRVRKVQNSQDGYSKGNLSRDNKRSGSGVTAHSASRPNSPFPMLFLRSRGAKPSPTMERRSSIVSNGSDVNIERFMERRVPYQTSKRVLNLPLLARRLEGKVEAPVSPSASDIDAFAEAARISELERARRDIVSPTAWLLDSDDYDNESAFTHEGSDTTDRRGVLELDTSFEGERTSEEDEFSPSYDDEKVDVEPFSSTLYNLRRASQPQIHCETESETENEGDVTVLRASQSWPLPPHRTVVVDEESGEGYHVMEPALEYAPARSVADSPRHSIRFPRRYSGSVSGMSCGSHQSESGSPTSQKLNSFQARLITETLGGPSEYDRDTSSNSLQAPQAPALRQKFLRSRSTTSLAASARSVKTNKTAFYSARSTESRGSDKSSFSFIRPQPFGKLSRDGSLHSASSSRSPPNSGGHGSKSASAYPASPPGSRSGLQSSVTTLTSNMESPAPYQETVSIPQRIVLRADDVEVCILASGWARLMSICSQNSSVQIETSQDDNALSALSVAVEEVDGCGDESNGTRNRPNREIDVIGDFESRPISRANGFIKLRLSLHQSQANPSGCDPRAKIAFRLPLPTTLGEVSNMLNQTQPR